VVCRVEQPVRIAHRLFHDPNRVDYQQVGTQENLFVRAAAGLLEFDDMFQKVFLAKLRPWHPFKPSVEILAKVSSVQVVVEHSLSAPKKIM